VERGTTRLLLGKQGAVLLGEMFEELIARSEIDAAK